MDFSEKIRTLRTAKGMTQVEVSRYLGVSERTYQNYEAGKYPRNSETYIRLAELFGVDAVYLMDNDSDVVGSESDDAYAAQRDLSKLLSEVGGLFAGGDLTEEDKDKFMESITKLYFRSKEKNSKGGTN